MSERSALLALLRQRTFGSFFAGRLASQIAVWVHNIAAVVLVFELTGSTLAVAFVSVAQFVPQMLLSAWGGALSDRYDRRKLLVMGRLPAGCACLVLGLVVLLPDGKHLVLATIYAVAVVSGAGWAIGIPSGLALVPALVERSDLPNAIALTSSTINIARGVGPAVAAGILFLGHAWTAFMAAGLAHIAFACIVLMLKPEGATRAVGNSHSRIRDGVSYVRHRDRLWVPLVAGLFLGFGMEPVLTLGPVLAVEFGMPETGAAIIATSFGAGAVAGVFFLPIAQRRWGLELSSIGGVLLLSVSLTAVGLAHWSGLALASLFLGGIGAMVATGSLQGSLQLLVDDKFRGRVMALWVLGFLGCRPVAALVLGAMSDAVGPRVAAVTAAMACSMVMVLMLKKWRDWGRQLGPARLTRSVG